jgi:sirohydrochlorin cobaltochelatase
MNDLARLADSALLLLGHGSTENPDSSAPTLAHADEIRRRGLFAEVQCAFWKEEPGFSISDYLFESETIYAVPNFISEGYFTREVIPRELGLEGPSTRRNGKMIHYCDPVGIHQSMTRLLAGRARELAPDIPVQDTALIIVGHGTGLNTKSTEAIRVQVDRLEALGLGYGQILDAYMEEAPFIADWDQLTPLPNVLVVPFFIADGLHSYQDIPVLLGIESSPTAAASQRDVFRQNPVHLRGRSLWYSRSIGTDPSLVDVILDQVHDFQSPTA